MKPCPYCLFPVDQESLRKFTPVGKFHCPLCKQRVNLYYPTQNEEDFYVIEPDDVEMDPEYRAKVKMLDKLRPHLKEMVVDGRLCLSNAYAVARAPGPKQFEYVDRLLHRDKPNPSIIAELCTRYPMASATMEANEDSSRLTPSQVKDKLTAEQAKWLRDECKQLLNQCESVEDAENYASDTVSDMINRFPDLEVYWEQLKAVVCLQLRASAT